MQVTEVFMKLIISLYDVA